MSTTATTAEVSVAHDPRENLVGVVARLAAADPALPVHDIYDAAGGRFYDSLRFSPGEIRVPVTLARRSGGPVLDLACGSGRIGLAVARLGVDVVGVDLSADMLGRFADRLAHEAADVRARVQLLRTDLHALALGHRPRFSLAVLGATTIVLVAPDRRRAFFAQVREQLVTGGAFALDVFPLDLAELRRVPERTSVLEVASPPGQPSLVACVQHFDLARRREQVSFLVSTVTGGGRWEQRAVTTAKWIVTVDEIVADLRAAGFELDDGRSDRGAGATGYRWLVGRAAP
jgi:SAM-dependent methyltransferase